MTDNTSIAERPHSQHNPQDNKQDHIQPRQNNIINLVVNNNQKKRGAASSKDPSLHRENLIKLTEKLARDAKSGRLRGLGIIAEFEDGYTFDLEGSYVLDPGCAVLPLVRLKKQILGKIEESESEEDEE